MTSRTCNFPEDNTVLTVFVQSLQNMQSFMPRRTKPERMKNPIRQLRSILAVPGSHLSQADLSMIVDIPLDSLSGIESGRQGRQGFSPLMQNRIKMNTGAVWNEKDECWRFWQEDGPKYTREHYQKYRVLMASHTEGNMLQLDIFFAVTRIRLLMETLPPRQRMKFWFRLNTFLDDNRKELCRGHFVELFFDANGRVGANPELDRNHPMRVVRFYHPRILRYLPDPKKLEEWSKIQFDLTGYEKMIKQERQRDVTGVLPRAEKKTAF